MQSSRSHQLRLLLVGLLGVPVIAGAAWLGWRNREPQVEGPVGKPAPDFELTSLQGEKVRLSSFRGRPVLLDWWALGCGYCQEQMPHVRQLAEKYRGRGLVVLVMHGWDDEDPDDIDQWAIRNRIKLTVLRPAGRVALQYGVTAYPSTTLIDRDGNIVLHPDALNPGDPAETEAEIEKLLP